MSKETQTMVPENAEPVYQLWSDEGFGGWTDTDKATYCWWLDSMNPPRMRKLYTAPVAAQPGLTQQTLDDVMAGIPARDAEIEALRKEIEALKTTMSAEPVVGDDFKMCAIADSNYASGMLLGWNLCVANDEASFNRIRGDRMLAAAQASRASKAQDAAPAATPTPAFSVGVHGVGIIDDNPSALAVYFNAAPNDDDIRALHEIVSGTPVAAQVQADTRTPADMLVNGGALILALNALRRAGKHEIADELEKTATRAQQPVSGADAVRAALEETQTLLAAMLHEQRPRSEISAQMKQNREALGYLPSAKDMPEPVGGADGLQARTDALYIALEVCSAELFAQCADQPRAMKYVEQARHALALEQCARAAAGRPAQLQPQPSGNAGEFPRLPLNDPAAAYRVLYEYGQSCARAALSQQDAETGKSVLVENQGVTPQTGHHCAEACHEWRQERTPCPKGQCKARNDADAIKYWGGKETWVRYLTDHTGLIQITARDIATCNAALDAVRNALAPGVGQQDADKVQADLLNSLVEIVDAVIASDEEGLIEHSETIIKARAAIDAARKEAAHG